MDYMIEQNLLDEPMFSLFLDRGIKKSHSKIIFGGYDKKLIIEEPHFHNVISSYYW